MTLPATDFSVLGATHDQWSHWRHALGLQRDLLPVVADPNAPISARSTLSKVGKTPSHFNIDGKVVGIPNWTNHASSAAEFRDWANDPRLGICVQTRSLRAIDVDLTDEAEAQQVRSLIDNFLFVEGLKENPPSRGRTDSPKFLLPVWAEGDLSKRVVQCAHGRVELLATGQQFVAVSTHPSGERYEWSGDGLINIGGEPMPAPGSFPTLTLPQLDQLLELLEQEVGVAPRAADPSQRAVQRPVSDDLERAVTLAQVDDETIEDLRSAVACLVDEAADYASWIRVGQALKSLEQAGAPQALDLWMEFSALCPEQFDPEVAREKWDGFEPSTITYRTVFELAQQHGWVNPRSAAALALAHAGGATRVDRTDAGNMALLADLTNGDLRFVPQRRVWLLWRDERWTVDEHGVSAQAAALRVAEHYHQKALEMRKQATAEGLDGKERKHLEQAVESLQKWATQCRNKRAIDNMLALAKGDSRFALSVLLLDRDPWLVGVENGVVDLRTGQLRAAARDDYVTRRAPVAFDPAARAPRWEQFIAEITSKPDGRGGFAQRPGLANYMRMALGYAMTGSTAEQKMFMAIGDGSNGKNVLLDTLQWILGDYCVTVPPEALMAVRGDSDAERPSPVAATLSGARVAISSESKDGQRLDVALVKRHTGGGYMTARFMRENSFRFEISHKLWLMTNHRPALDHLDDAMRGRLHLIPFDMRWNRPGHPERDPMWPDGDKDLPGKLRGEAQGVLAWLVAGAVAYCQHGLVPPTEVVQMTRDFFADQDPLGRWIDSLTRCQPREGTAASELLEDFRRWRDEEGETGGPDNIQAFARSLQQRGVARLVTSGPKLYALKIASSRGFA